MIKIRSNIHPNKYIEADGYTLLKVISDKHGTKYYEIDNDDVDNIKLYHWGVSASKSNKSDYVKYYASSNIVGLLHRYIMNAPKGKHIDHIDGSEYNNRKYNLRKCTQNENNKNRKLNKNNTSGVKGVRWAYELNTPKWHAYIHFNKRFKSLGYYFNFEDAVNARLTAEEKYFGEFKHDIKYDIL